MSDPVLQSQIEAARAYEAMFVPGLFGEWAPRLAAATGIHPGQRVLDVACGTGVLARAVQSLSGPTGYVAGLDPNPGMLVVARDLADTVDWRLGVAESIPFPENTFDAVVSQFGLMFFDDRRQALREMLRVLTADGRLGVAVWDAVAAMPAYADETALLERLAGNQAANAIRAPFVLGDRQQLSELFGQAGAASVAVATHEGVARFPSIRTMIEADLRGWLPVMGVKLTEEQIGSILREAEHVFSRYCGADGGVQFATRAHFVTAVPS
ncbi:MAG: methyltransferase type 11 [Burkholderiaceae bacterium]|nr:methyltransferase type 11 [Burkholderiaceae bacterium]